MILHLSNDSLVGFNEEILSSITEFYQNSDELKGFQTVSNLKIEPITNEKTLLTYTITYNFANLLSSAVGNVRLLNEVGKASSVKSGLENQNFFSSSNRIVLNDNFTFTGDSLCARVGCLGGEFVTCTESTNGETTFCSSSCKQNFCVNGGWCHHTNGNLPPTCTCKNTFDTWYIGERCELFVQLWMFLVFIVVIFLAIVTVVVTTCIYLYNIDKRKYSVKYDEKFQINKEKTLLPSALAQNTNKLTVKDISSGRLNSNNSSIRYVNGPTNALLTESFQLTSEKKLKHESSEQTYSLDEIQKAYVVPDQESSNSFPLFRMDSKTSDDVTIDRDLSSKNDVNSITSSIDDNDVKDYDQKFREIAKTMK